MRLHLPALPGQPTVRKNSHCAYTQKIRKFCKMMLAQGHEVYLYGLEENDVVCTEYIACYPEGDSPAFEPIEWRPYNLAASKEIRARCEPGDILGIIAGRCQEELANDLPDLFAVEYGIGYGGVFAEFRVYESYAWMHTVQASGIGDAHAVDGRFYDTVIPNFFDLDDFTPGGLLSERDDYVLYVGRMIDRKGVQVAADAAEMAGVPFIMAGHAGPGDTIPSYGEYVGVIGPEARSELMSNARALLAPTQYIEPFGGVAVEAQLCGTPAITTDWGAFTETVLHGQTGYRCRTLGEFAKAIELVEDLNVLDIRHHAVANYSLERIGPVYNTYLEQINGLKYPGVGDWPSTWQGLTQTHRYGLLPNP